MFLFFNGYVLEVILYGLFFLMFIMYMVKVGVFLVNF